MKHLVCFLSLVIVIYVIISIKGLVHNSRAATVSLLREEGRNIIKRIEQENDPNVSWPLESSGRLCYSNSTSYLNAVFNTTTVKERKRLLRYSFFVAKELRRNVGLRAADNVWTIVKNMPTNAPDSFIVLATKNIDPLSLRTCLTTNEMDQQISFLPFEKDGILAHYGLVFRKDGSSYAIRRLSRYSTVATYRLVYENCPFDIRTNLSNNTTVKYLTPYNEAELSNHSCPR